MVMSVLNRVLLPFLFAVSVWANEPIGVQAKAPEVHVELIGKDSLKVQVTNVGDSPICYHVPNEIDSHIENGILNFIPKFQKNMAHMEGRPFDYKCLQPRDENALKQEYSAEYALKSPADLKKITQIGLTWGTPEEFRSLQAIGPRDYKKECEYLKTLQKVKLRVR